MSWEARSVYKNISRNQVLDELETAAVAYSLGGAGIHSGSGDGFPELVAIGEVQRIDGNTTDDLLRLRQMLDGADDLVIGFFTFQTKDLLEDLGSFHTDRIGFSTFSFIIPEVVYRLENGQWNRYAHAVASRSGGAPSSISLKKAVLANPFSLEREDYLKRVRSLQRHIQRGDIYEVNFCMEHGFEHAVVEPYSLYSELRKRSPAPFSCYVADRERFLISSSPERFMRKSGQRIISQPIKGTNRRAKDNKRQQQMLKEDAKERAENIMITDLVRNDLSRSAKKGTVSVDELCGVYAFEHVNQMISTVSAEMREDVHPLDALMNAFPMGSMTGAPKIRAMQLIEEHEDFARGLYSGTVGYFTPEGDFDFNVVIRSILYNAAREVVTFPTGSAITINSDPEKEFEECMLKAEAMQNVLRDHAK